MEQRQQTEHRAQGTTASTERAGRIEARVWMIPGQGENRGLIDGIVCFTRGKTITRGRGRQDRRKTIRQRTEMTKLETRPMSFCAGIGRRKNWDISRGTKQSTAQHGGSPLLPGLGYLG